jgi:hypothetical protein
MFFTSSPYTLSKEGQLALKSMALPVPGSVGYLKSCFASMRGFPKLETDLATGARIMDI